MRITELSRFPHPVLSLGSKDFASGEFDLNLNVHEQPSTGAVFVEHEALLTEPSIRELVESGKAAIGVFVQCDDTYYAELRRMSWPQGRTDFIPGDLLNRVTIRPLIWLDGNLDSWNPSGVHPEFQPPVSLASGEVIAVGLEQIFNVGQAKLAPLESIFELKRSDEMPDGSIRVDPEAERILILAGQGTFEAISLLREQRTGLPVLLNGVYLPAVMEVLDLLRSGSGEYSNRRWHPAFIAKCDAKGVDVNNLTSLMESAHMLLDYPAKHLTQLLAEGGGES